MAIVLLLLCGCGAQENKRTQFLFDTVVTLTADCGDEVLDGAFELCREYEQLLSRTVEGSDVQRLNSTDDFVEVSHHTRAIIDRSLYYSQMSNGKFDITIYPVSSLWNFKDEVIPEKSEIAEALQSVDYQSIEADESRVSLGGAKIDLGGIAKGYIADRVLEYFSESGVESGIIDLGGNIIVFGERDFNVGIKKPFSADELAATVSVRNKTVVTSGIYERYIKSGSKLYHHILNPKTGYPAKTDLYSATIISDSSLDADALATVCVLLGHEEAKSLIEIIPDTEAIFIDSDYNISYTSGLIKQDSAFTLK